MVRLRREIAEVEIAEVCVQQRQGKRDRPDARRGDEAVDGPLPAPDKP
jgi:hypothetical protein